MRRTCGKRAESRACPEGQLEARLVELMRHENKIADAVSMSVLTAPRSISNSAARRTGEHHKGAHERNGMSVI